MRAAVVWRGRASHPALAVHCGACNAMVGQVCQGDTPTGFHRARREYAAALGFAWAPGACPPSEAAYLAALDAAPAAAAPAQAALL